MNLIACISNALLVKVVGVIFCVLVIFVIVCLLVIFTLSHFTHLTDLDKSDRLYLKRSLDITMLMFTLALLSSVPEV